MYVNYMLNIPIEIDIFKLTLNKYRNVVKFKTDMQNANMEYITFILLTSISCKTN